MGVKYTLEQVIEFFTENECILLSTEYTKNTQVLKFTCKCQNEINMTFKKYLVQKCCDTCHSKTLQRRFKYTFEEVQKIFTDQECVLVSTEYKNQTTELEYICKCNLDVKVKTSLKKFLKNGHCQQCGIEQRKSTNLEKYGHIYPSSSNEVKLKHKNTIENKTIEEKEKTKEKRKKTNIIKYGVEHGLQSKEIRQKGKETNLEKYGVEFTLQVPEIRKKGFETMIEKYGVHYPMQCSELHDKIKATNLIRYGVEETLHVSEILEKIKETNLERYGFEIATQNPEIYNKVKATNLERHGFEFAMQNPELAEKAMINSHKYKEYKFPSRKIVKVQGYENFALDILLKTYQEEDILTNRTDMPEIWYNHFDKKRRYFPDIYIEKENKIIEIKSIYTYKQNLIQNICKALGTRKSGYDYEIWIMAKNKLMYVI